MATRNVTEKMASRRKESLLKMQSINEKMLLKNSACKEKSKKSKSKKVSKKFIKELIRLIEQQLK